MKRLLATSFSIFVLLFVFASYSFAQDSIEPATGIAKPDSGLSIVPPYQGDTFLGQNHSYSVVFRGNGEAIVSLRVALGNSGEDPIETLNLRIPRVAASGIYVFQIFKEKQCVRYQEQVYDPLIRRYPTPVCTEYQEPNYYNDYYYYNAKYKKADYEYKNDTLTVDLPKPVEAGKSGALFIYFRASGYAKKDFWGSYVYTFESLQVEDTITNLNIGLSTDSDLFMKGVKGEVDYRFNDVSPTVTKLEVGGGEGVANSALDSFVTQIGSGQIYKSASNLMPLESYKVEGSYAKSRGALYGKEITIAAVSLLVVTVLVVLATVVIYRTFKRGTVVEKGVEKKEVTDIKKQTPSSASGGKMFALVALVGFVTSLIMALYTVLVVVLGVFLSRNIYYSYQSLVGIVLVIISILIYLLLISAPGILIGFKKGVGWGLGTVVATILWLIFWAILIFLGLFLFGNGGGFNSVLRTVSPMPL